MHYENPSKVQICLSPVIRFRFKICLYIMFVNQKPNFRFGRLDENQVQKSVSVILISWLQSLYFSNGIGVGIGIFEVYHRLSVTSQAQFFTNNKLKSSFSLKNKNLMNDNIKESSLEFLTQLDERDSLSSLYDTPTMLPQKTLRHCCIFNDTSPSFYVMSYMNIMLSNAI